MGLVEKRKRIAALAVVLIGIPLASLLAEYGEDTFGWERWERLLATAALALIAAGAVFVAGLGDHPGEREDSHRR